MPTINKINGTASDTFTKINGTTAAVNSFMNVTEGNVGGVDRNIPFFNSHSIDLDGSSDYIDLVNGIGGFAPTSGAVSIWTKLDASSSNSYLFQISSDTSASNNRIIIYWSHSNSKIGYTLKYAGENAQYNWASTGIKGDNTWHHIVMIWSPGDEGTIMTACFDGTCQDGIESAGSLAGSAAAMTLGRASTGSSSFYDGHVDEFTMWNTTEGTPLTAADVDILYNARRGCTTHKDVEDYDSSRFVSLFYKMEENSGTAVISHGGTSGSAAVSASDLWTNDTF